MGRARALPQEPTANLRHHKCKASSILRVQLTQAGHRKQHNTKGKEENTMSIFAMIISMDTIQVIFGIPCVLALFWLMLRDAR